MFASRAPIPLVCLLALGLAAGGLEWARARQEANGRASLTRAARRYARDREAPRGQVLLTEVRTEVGGRRGLTEFQVLQGTWRGPVLGETVTLEWARDAEGDWVPLARRPR